MRDYNDIDNLSSKTITLLVSFAVLIITIVFVHIIQGDSNNIKWNDGICPKDNTSWKYSNSAHSKYWRYDYYVCEDGHVIELVNDYETR